AALRISIAPCTRSIGRISGGTRSYEPGYLVNIRRRRAAVHLLPLLHVPRSSPSRTGSRAPRRAIPRPWSNPKTRRGPIPRQDVVQSQDVILARYRDTTTLSESPVVRERYERTARVGRRSRPIMHPPERSMGRLSWVRRAWRRWRRALCRF